MTWKIARRFVLAATLLFSALPARSEDAASFDTGMIPTPHILMPKGAVTAAVVLLSDASGWSAKEDALAGDLNDQGALVIGIDLPRYLAALAADKGDCIYMVSDIEALSQQVQRAAKNDDYRLPIVAGVGAGAALALAIAAQTPPATFGQTLAVDPEAGIALTKQLCTPADKKTVGDRMIYGLTDGPLPDPITVVLTAAAPVDGRDHVTALTEAHGDITVTQTDEDMWTVFSETLSALVTASAGDDNPIGLPLTILDAKPTRDTMAIVYSGDGGWRDIDKQVGDVLQQQGMPVVGVDSLRYFWSERKAQETADDLHRIIAFYTKRWNVRHILLIGYSFGADILPRTYTLLPKNDRDRIPQVTLMAVSHQVDYKISVLGWLGASGADGAGDPTDDIAKIDPSLLQCIYGTDEDDDVCPTLKEKGVETIGIDGGHHFDGDYPALVRRILDSFDRRMAARPTP